jgi:hypothetical protein
MGPQGPAAKPESRRGILPIEIAPDFRATGARPRNRISEFRLSLGDDGLLRRFWLRDWVVRSLSMKSYLTAFLSAAVNIVSQCTREFDSRGVCP